MKAMESKVMRAMRLANTSTGKPQFTEAEVPQPKPGSGEVLVRVHAAGVTASEVIWQPTTNTKDGGPRSNATSSAAQLPPQPPTSAIFASARKSTA